MWSDPIEFLVSLNWIQEVLASEFKPDSYSASDMGFPVWI